MSEAQAPGPAQAQRRRRRWPWFAAVSTAVAALAAASVTDARAHTRDRHERQVLDSTRQRLSRTQYGIDSVRYARGLAGGHLQGAQDSLTVTQDQLQRTQQSLSDTSKAEYIQGVAIDTLNTCLSGVKGAYQQIAAHDNEAATGDIAAASADCLAIDGTQGAGLVYPFDFPDPFVLRDGSTYFAYATNSAEGNIQIITSTDLTHWSAVGNALPKLPVWAAPDQTWAPSVRQVGGTFVLYYSAVVAGPHGGEQCISAATATQPQGPFVDDSGTPLVCQSGLNGSIDPSPFVDAGGTPYLQWKSDGGGGQPATIWSEQLNAAGTGFAPTASPVRLLEPDQHWEGGVVEAPDLVLSGGHYYLFYSGNNWDGADYAVGVASCRGPLGPCSAGSSQPVLASGLQMAGPGGETVFTDSAGSLWIAFDAWVPGAVGYPHSRALYLRPLSLSGASIVVEPAG